MKLDRLKMHQEWFDRNQHMIFLEARIVMQELLAMTREARNERDEARREVCGFHHLTGFLGGDYAISRGWDCYKNYSGEGFPQSVKDFKKFLKEHSDADFKTIERLREDLSAERHLTGRILAEIDCRVEHGADSNGHLETILKLFSNKEF